MYKSNYENPWYKLMFLGLEYFGRYYSTYQGIVVDNEDPLKMNRVKVIYPQLIKNDTGTWAVPRNNWGGKNYGKQLLPQKGDTVYIEFYMGDLEYPIWSHGFYGENELPPEFNSPNVYGFKTPKGTIILIDDNDDSGSILVKYKNNKEYIKIIDDVIELEAKTIRLGKNGKEFAVLGETLHSKLENLTAEVEKLSTAISTHTHSSNNVPPTQASTFTTISGKLSSIKQSLKEILSAKVKID